MTSKLLVAPPARARPGPLANSSRQPVPPQTQGPPALVTGMWPSSPARPRGPINGRPSTITPPPTPVPKVNTAMHPRPRPPPELAQGGGVAVVFDGDRDLEPAAQLGTDLVVPGGQVGAPDEVLAVGRQPRRHSQAHGHDLATQARRHRLALGDGRLQGDYKCGQPRSRAVQPYPVDDPYEHCRRARRRVSCHRGRHLRPCGPWRAAAGQHRDRAARPLLTNPFGPVLTRMLPAQSGSLSEVPGTDHRRLSCRQGDRRCWPLCLCGPPTCWP